MKKYIRKILMLSLILVSLGNYQVKALSYSDDYRVYKSKGVNIRSEDGSYQGYLKKGHIVDGLLEGNYLKIVDGKEPLYMHTAYMERVYAWPDFYKSLGVNMRDMNDKKIGYMVEDRLLSGIEDGDYVYLVEDGNFIKLHKAFLEKRSFQEPLHYISLGGPILDRDGNELTYLKAGEKVEGYPYKKDTIEVVYGAYVGELDEKYLILDKPVTNYRSLGANIRDSEGNLVFRLDKGETIKARRSLGRIYFSHEGKKVSAHPKYLRKINR